MTAQIQNQPLYQFISSFPLLSKATGKVTGTLAAGGGYVYDRLPPRVSLALFTGLNYVLKTALVVVPLAGVIASRKVTDIALVALAIVGCLVLVEFTLKRGSMDELNARFQTAVSQGDLVNSVFALAAGANVEARFGDDERTPLLVAISHGHTAVVLALIEAGADVNASCTFSGKTPLRHAVTCYDEAAVRALMQAGDALNESNSGNAGLEMAVIARRYAGIVRALLEAGARLDMGTEMRDGDRVTSIGLI